MVGFGEYVVLGDKKGDEVKIFETFSLGVATGRDAWCYNHSKLALADQMSSMINFYNHEVTRFDKTHPAVDKKTRVELLDKFITYDQTKISWERGLKNELAKGGSRFTFSSASLTIGLYRPFTKQWMYFNRRFNAMVYQMPRIYPDITAENIVIGVSGIGAKKALHRTYQS